jgi:hypothetical protein
MQPSRFSVVWISKSPPPPSAVWQHPTGRSNQQNTGTGGGVGGEALGIGASDAVGCAVGGRLRLHCEHDPHAIPPSVRFMSSKLVCSSQFPAIPSLNSNPVQSKRPRHRDMQSSRFVVDSISNVPSPPSAVWQHPTGRSNQQNRGAGGVVVGADRAWATCATVVGIPSDRPYLLLAVSTPRLTVGGIVLFVAAMKVRRGTLALKGSDLVGSGSLSTRPNPGPSFGVDVT